MNRLWAAAILAVALAVAGSAPSPASTAAPPREMLEETYAGVEFVLAHKERPTMRDLLRRLSRMEEQGRSPGFGPTAWVRTRRQIQAVYDHVAFNECSGCPVLVTRGKNSAKHSLRSRIRLGAFIVGWTPHLGVTCVGPRSPDAYRCHGSPWRH